MSILNQSFHETSTGCLGCCTETSHPFSRSRYADAHDDDKQRLTGDDQQKKQEMDNMLLQAFNALSFEERQVQQEQLHGVADEVAEKESLIQNSLQELEFHLSQTKAGRVYETAERMSPAYVHARSFRITFLRSERYNVKAAADRMLRFFDEKQKLFGMAKLTKDITLEDLGEDGIAALKSGTAQWAGRDRSNRPILFQVTGLRKFKELKDELRARYFVMMEGVKSPEAQLRGFVMLTYAVGNFRDPKNGQGYLEHHRLSEALPVYFGALHFAVDDIKQHLLGAAAISLLPAARRARFRLHLGTHLECQYSLSSFGISPALLPVSLETNAIDMAPHLRWCDSYRSRSDSGGIKNSLMPLSATGAVITEPSPNDVLSAGTTKSNNVGNDRLRSLVKEQLEAYTAGSNDAKRHIVDCIIGAIHDMGGRFLQQEKTSRTWKELPPSKMREKITQRFRNHNRRRENVWQQTQEGTPIAGMPLPNDVILGRTHDRNYGTALLHQLIKERSEEYEALDRRMKVVVVDGIIERIQSEGGRFLQPSRFELSRYVELSSADSIRDRISIYVRNYRRKAFS